MATNNVFRLMRRVYACLPVDAAEWFKQKQYLDAQGNLDLLGILEARLMQERKRADRMFYISTGLVVLLSVGLPLILRLVLKF